MPRPSPDSIKQKAMRLMAEGHTIKQVCRKLLIEDEFQIAESTIKNWRTEPRMIAIYEEAKIEVQKRLLKEGPIKKIDRLQSLVKARKDIEGLIDSVDALLTEKLEDLSGKDLGMLRGTLTHGWIQIQKQIKDEYPDATIEIESQDEKILRLRAKAYVETVTEKERRKMLGLDKEPTVIEQEVKPVESEPEDKRS